LIASTQRDIFPQYSPDGRRIAFYSNRSGSYEIWACDADGSKAAPVTLMKRGTTGSPRWSPDGSTIAFDSNETGRYQVYTVGAEGGKVRQITSGVPHFGSNWSRDGRWIYFASSEQGNEQVWKIPSQGGDTVQVTRNGGSRLWFAKAKRSSLAPFAVDLAALQQFVGRFVSDIEEPEFARGFLAPVKGDGG
jgi:Tol biopolymer transport system component